VDITFGDVIQGVCSWVFEGKVVLIVKCWCARGKGLNFKTRTVRFSMVVASCLWQISTVGEGLVYIMTHVEGDGVRSGFEN
jgi:hypothetical protein